MERAGLLTTKSTWKQTFKHALIEEKEHNELKVQQSKHTMSLQKSRYLMVESTEAASICAAPWSCRLKCTITPSQP